ncbi:MAG: ATP-binding cassette domain-containing protein, partial [Elusimicrobiota bacterium]
RSRKLWGRLSSEEEKAVEEACEKTSLGAISDKLFTDCSGGQKQRARLAQALAQQPDVLVLDEPTTGLDVNIERDFLLLVKSLQKKENLTILFVTHTIHIPLYFADDTFILREGQLTSLTNKELQDPYTLEKYYGAPLNYQKLAQTPHHD